jgi:peptide/nickel transport system substrate-binding protein
MGGKQLLTWIADACLVLGLAAACAPGGSRPSASPGGGQTPVARPVRTLDVAIQVEPGSLASRALVERGVALHTTKRAFNADLALLDDRGLPQPYLAEALPQLNSDSWQVFPDGRMETTYRLRPNLTWHDGSSLTTDDFVFSFAVYSTPALGLSSLTPFGAMDEVVPQDDRTLVIRWRRPYPDADQLAQYTFPPLPRHVLGQAFQDDPTDSFANHPYWTRQFVGLGPFRLMRWEPGAFMEAAVFEGHALGRPGIERLRITFIGEPNAALANMLTGTIQLAADGALDFRRSVALKREWEPQGAGHVLFHPNQWNSVRFQFRPEIVTPRALLDVRVRRALAHAIDKHAFNDALFEGEGVLAETMLDARSGYAEAVDRAIARYSFDPQRSERLMNEAGFTRGADGLFAGPEGRFQPQVRYFDPPANTAEGVAIASGWRQAGFDVQDLTYPFAQAQDNQARAQFQAMFIFQTGVGEPALIGQTSSGIPRADNRWTGGNRGGWSDPEYDRLVDAFNSTLDRAERTRQVAELTRIYTEALPGISLWYPTQQIAWSSAIQGPVLPASNALAAWNMYQWEMR